MIFLRAISRRPQLVLVPVSGGVLDNGWIRGEKGEA
jgi:hypothetical protein